eukprot:gene18318-28225_t
MERLHAAARKGNEELVARLIRGGIKVSIANKFGCTVLHLAARLGHVGMLRTLSEHRPVHTPWHGKYPLHFAVMNGNVEVASELVKLYQKHDVPLETVLNQPDEDEVSTLGDACFEPPTTNLTPLHYAVILKNPAMIEYLLSAGAQQNLRDKFGKVPLVHAIEDGDEEGFAILLANKPPLHAADKHGNSPLHTAAKRGEVTLLAHMFQTLAAGPSDATSSLLTSTNEFGETPLSIVIEHTELQLLSQIIGLIEAFTFQQLRLHDSRTVHPERIAWKPPMTPSSGEKHETLDPRTGEPLSPEARKEAVVKMLQAKLDEVNMDNANASVKMRKGRRNNAG